VRVPSSYQVLYLSLPLAAHTVVIKGVRLFLNNADTEYSDLDIVQMIGRAVCVDFPSPILVKIEHILRVALNLVRRCGYEVGPRSPW
jgi:hypothetical protein